MSPVANKVQWHASCVAVGDGAVLLLGASGSGKSDLCLRLIDRGAALIADDRVELRREGKALLSSAPEAGIGLLELHGLGVLRIRSQVSAPVILAVQLTGEFQPERLPSPDFLHCLGLEIPQIRLNAFEISAALKVEQAVKALTGSPMVAGAFQA